MIPAEGFAVRFPTNGSIEAMSEIFLYSIHPRYSGLTLGDFLADFSLAKKKINIIENQKCIQRNHESLRLDSQLQAHDVLEIDVSPFDQIDYVPDSGVVDVLYEDEWVYVLEKPAKMIIHPEHKSEHGTLANLAAAFLEYRGLNRSVRYLHRLDQDTTGAILFAKHFLAHAFLDRHWNHVDVHRAYLCLVEGRVKNTQGTIDFPIGQDRHQNNVYRVSRSGKAARSRYCVMAYGYDWTLLKVVLETGRTHQIRVHLSAIGHPLVGDRIYGAKRPYERVMLHSAEITFLHPESRGWTRVDSPMPDDFQKYMDTKMDTRRHQ